MRSFCMTAQKRSIYVAEQKESTKVVQDTQGRTIIIGLTLTQLKQLQNHKTNHPHSVSLLSPFYRDYVYKDLIL